MDVDKLRDKFENEEQNDEYIGNIWGWKFSFIGLFFILMTLGLMYYGQKSGKVDYFKEPTPQSTPAVDSSQTTE